MNWRLVKAIILLPGTVLVFVPAAVLLLSRETPLGHEFQYPMEITFLFALALISAGTYLAVTSTRLFMRSGQGTPAPWNPPKALVIQGLYRYVRNPMIGGVVLIMVGESLLFNSWPLFLWALLFLAGKHLYLQRIEEKELIRRFGDAYASYLHQVPRWLPRLYRWEG